MTNFADNKFNARDSCPADIRTDMAHNLMDEEGGDTVTEYAIEEILVIGNEVESDTGDMIFKVDDTYAGLV